MVSFKSLALIAAATCLADAKKLFIENDSISLTSILIPLMGGWEIVGISASFGSSSFVDALGGHSKALEDYELTECIPLYGGAQQPLIRTNETFHVWEELYGTLVWEGAWSSVYSDIYEWDEITYNETMPGALALIEAVKANKDTDPVTILAAGTMTTVAQAISIYPNLTQEAAGLYIMGGYIDVQYAHATGNGFQDDLVSDINIIQDPEAAQIVLTADWNEIVIGGNVTNHEVPSQELYDRMIDRAGDLDTVESSPFLVGVDEIVNGGNYTANSNNTENILPFWDSVSAAFLAYPELITGSSNFSLAVDTSFYSPFYGTVRIWNHDRAPRAIKTGHVTVVDSIDQDMYYDLLVDSLFSNYTGYCLNGTISDLEFD